MLSQLVAILLFIHTTLASDFRWIPEHVFNMDVALICQPRNERLDLNAVVSVWEADVVTKDDFLGKIAISNAKHFEYLFRHAEFGRVDPYLVIYHDCNSKVVKGQCYAKTEFRFEEPAELGLTIYLQIDLLHEPSDLICDKGYPFSNDPPLKMNPNNKNQHLSPQLNSTKLNQPFDP